MHSFITLFILNLEHNYYGDTLLHSAVLADDAPRVQDLLKLGAKTSDTTVMGKGENTIANVTALNIAIYNQNPVILALLLQTSDSTNAITIKCKDGNEACWSSLSLALNVAEETKMENAQLVCVHFMLE